MSVAPLAIEVVCVCCLAAYLLHRYGDYKKQHILVTVAVFVAWYFSLMIVFVLPLDVSNTCYRQCLAVNRALSTSAPSTTTLSTNFTTPASANSSQAPESRGVRELRDQDAITMIDEASRPPDSTWQPMVDGQSSQLVGPAVPNHGACQKPWSYVDENILDTLWHVVYWTSQFLTWLMLPMMQSYANAGDFTVAGKIKSSLIENAIYYGTYLLIFGVCLVYVAVKPGLHLNGSQLKVLAITASNTWGLFLLVLLLGYGLVEVPRSLWNNSRKGGLLNYTYFRIAKLSTEKTEAEENLEDVLDDVKKAAETIGYNHSFRKYVDTILEKCPESLRSSVKRNRDDFEDYNNPTETPTEKSLVRLHKKVITSSQAFRRTQCQWHNLVREALELENIASSEGSSHSMYSGTPYEGIFKHCYSPTLDWYWKCWIRPWAFKIIAIFLMIFSFMVVWSECLFFVIHPVLSLFAWFMALATEHYHYFWIEFVCLVTITYLCFCAYYTIFKIRIFNYYYLASHHQTGENSLIFCGMLLCRLTPPLCLNFLGLIHMDTHVTKQSGLEETSYTQIMGHMDVIPFISDGFNIYFPIAIVLLCIATFFHLGSRCLHFLGFQQFIGDDAMTQDFIDEGRELVRREKRKRQRKEDGEARRRNWNERFGSGSRSGDSDSEAGGRIKPSKPYSARHQDSDRQELLRQAEPVDYMADAADPFEDYPTGGSINSDDIMGRYQSQPLRGSSVGQYGGRSVAPPPKGIFDDV